MAAALMTYVHHVELPPEPGLSPRALRSILGVYCRIAQSDGSFRYGLRGSKVAALADYSLATVRRAQRYLVAHGFLERVQQGGGRASTRWRVVLDRLGVRHASSDELTPQTSSPDTAHGHSHRLFSRMLGGGSRQDGPSPPVHETCEHGSRAGLMPSRGVPWCPQCRQRPLRR